jgi:short-subunit dehydrogenase
MRRYAFTGTAVVTGAASGIGAALAPQLAARGNDLVLLDRDAERLDGVAAAVRTAFPGRSVDTLVADLADAGQLRDAAGALVTGHPGTTLLVNNAGVALGGRFDQVTVEEFDWVVDVNFRAAVRLTHALLPVLESHPGSHLVNVSSIFGIMAPAGQAAYSSSKFALRGFTEVLRHELAEDGVGVTSVHPGGIATRIAESARVGSGVDPVEAEQGKREFAAFLRYPADRAAARIVTAVERRRPRQLIGASAVVPDLLVRIAPGSYGRILAGATRLAGLRRGA